MTRSSFGLALVAAGTLATLSAQDQGPTFRGSTDTVPVYVTVTDRSDRLVTDLRQADFEILDNGKSQPITLFDNSPRPIRLVVMLDVSGSMARNLPILREASVALFSRLRSEDQTRLGAFGNDIDITPSFTNDPAALRRALPMSIDPDAPTPLWRAMDAAMGALTEVSERRVVVVFSDGKDFPRPGFRERYVGQFEVTDRAQREEVMIYAIGFQSRSMQQPMGRSPMDLRQMLTEDLPDPNLGKVALESGGGYFEVRPRDDLAAAFARIADELHSQYLLGFSPASRDGKSHKIEVRMVRKDLKPRARRNYTAPK